MPEAWTGHLLGEMHNNDITYDALAEELGCTKAYLSMIFNGKRKPDGIQERMESAVSRVVQRKQAPVQADGQ